MAARLWKRRGHGDKLPHGGEEVISALLESGGNVKAAATKCGVHYQTIHRWLRRPDFYAAYQTELNALQTARRNLLLRMVGGAAASLARALDAKTPLKYQLAAARIIFAESGRNASAVAERSLVDLPASQEEAFDAFLASVGGHDAEASAPRVRAAD